MSKKVSPTAVGMFVSGALVLVIVGLVLLGTGRFLETQRKFVVYFQTSANGLQEGSEVRLGGVKIGSVDRMYVQFDPVTDQKVIPVVIELSADRIAALSADYDRDEPILSRESIAEAIESGLRARLMNQSALTGQLYVDLDYLPDEQGGYIFPGPTVQDLPQIPTVKSQIQQVLDVIAASVEELGRADLGDILDRITDLLVNLDAKITELDLESMSKGASATLESANGAIRKIDALAENVNKAIADDRLGKVVGNLNETLVELKNLVAAIDARGLQDALQSANKALHSLDAAAANIARFTEPDAPTAIQLKRTLADLEDAAASIKELAEFLRRNPNALLTGKKKP